MGKKDTGLMPKEVALGKATALCGGSEHCSSQIMEKLSSWNVSVQDANDIMDYLIKEKYIDNSRFARAYCHDKFAKDRTLKDKDKYLCKAKLVRHLLSKGFETELVIDAADSYLDL